MTERDQSARLVQTASQLASVLSATIHVTVVWRKNVSRSVVGSVVQRWADIIAAESDNERVILLILDDLARIDPAFHIAWQLLTDSQNTSCCNAMRTILHEFREGRTRMA